MRDKRYGMRRNDAPVSLVTRIRDFYLSDEFPFYALIFSIGVLLLALIWFAVVALEWRLFYGV